MHRNSVVHIMATEKKMTTTTMKVNANAIETCDLRRFLRQHPFLAQLLPSNGVVFQCDGDAPSPSKDYGQLEINLDKLVLRWWRITLRNVEGSLYPSEIKDTYEDFVHDEVAQREIWRIFGPRTLDHCLNVVRGRLDWFSRLPLPIQILILSFLTLDDIPHLSLVSKFFRTLCRHNELWKIFYARQHGRQTMENNDLLRLAERRGWRHVFFTNRLKLQMELRREAQVRRIPTPPTVARRHSFGIRKDRFSMSPLPNREGSARSTATQSPLPMQGENDDDDDQTPWNSRRSSAALDHQ